MRRSLSTTARLKIWEAAEGRCHLCGLQIRGKWEVEHRIPVALGGADEAANMAPAHIDCHAGKTRQDVAAIARAKRRKARFVGAKQSKWPKSKWKRKVSGETVLR